MTMAQIWPDLGCQRLDPVGPRPWLPNHGHCLVPPTSLFNFGVFFVGRLWSSPPSHSLSLMAIVLVATTFADMVAVAPTPGPTNRLRGRRSPYNGCRSCLFVYMVHAPKLSVDSSTTSSLSPSLLHVSTNIRGGICIDDLGETIVYDLTNVQCMHFFYHFKNLFLSKNLKLPFPIARKDHTHKQEPCRGMETVRTAVKTSISSPAS